MTSMSVFEPVNHFTVSVATGYHDLWVSLLLNIISLLVLLLAHHDVTVGAVIIEHYFTINVVTGSS